MDHEMQLQPYEVAAPDAQGNVGYSLIKALMHILPVKKILDKPVPQLRETAEKMVRKSHYPSIPQVKGGECIDRIIGENYHCAVFPSSGKTSGYTPSRDASFRDAPVRNMPARDASSRDASTPDTSFQDIAFRDALSHYALLYVFGGGMITPPDNGDYKQCREIAARTGRDVWYPLYPLCLEHDVLENIDMIVACYEDMLHFYAPEDIVFMGFSSGGALILDTITRINELNDARSGITASADISTSSDAPTNPRIPTRSDISRSPNIPMPGMLVAVSPGSILATSDEEARLKALEHVDLAVPLSFMETVSVFMDPHGTVPKKYLATAHGDYRYVPMIHFYYGSAELLYAFAPSYAETLNAQGVPFVVHVGHGMHHCYALQPAIPGCRKAYDEIIELLKPERA